MNKYRYTITLEADDDFLENENDEQLKQEFISIMNDYSVEKVKILLEDDYCIRKNNKLDKAKSVEIIFKEMANTIYNATQQKLLDDTSLDYMIDWCKRYEKMTNENLDIKDFRD